jgi:hypothetical protein
MRSVLANIGSALTLCCQLKRAAALAALSPWCIAACTEAATRQGEIETPASERRAATEAKLSAADIEAEELRRHLDSQHMIKGADAPSPVAGAMESMLGGTLTTGIAEIAKLCVPSSVVTAPSRVEPRITSAFEVLFNPQACTHDACEALASNCLTIGTSVFCDLSYLERVHMVGRWAGLQVLMSGQLGVSPYAMLAPDAIQQLLDWQAGKDPQSTIRSLAFGVESLFQETISENVLMATLGHELAHVEENHCRNGGAPRATTATPLVLETAKPLHTQRLLDQYFEFSCDKVLRESEVAADLRGIALAKDVADVKRKLAQWSIRENRNSLTKFDKLPPVESLAVRKMSILPALVAMNTYEYEVVFAQHPRASRSWLAKEPTDNSVKSLLRHYFDAGRSVCGAGSRASEAGHLPLEYRVTLALASYGAPELLDDAIQSGEGILPAGIRLKGYLAGALACMRSTNCGVSDDSASADAIKLLTTLIGSKGQLL